MLQVKDLVKRYATKGNTVVALDHVSVDFPEKGMVFLLGKSGSGKSTLLNVSGGLDSPDEGEIVVKGKSSKEFSKSDFDSYRNTYVGFVFQEYNILNELTVAENVALALELQGKPKDEQRVEELLKEVDLEGLGDRRPNTLSGGQKQRVAIARALVKSPEIIMADEPTGALDSATGAQVLDTLKKLSASKLVVVVSHDRDFAEHYADRIIELKDGRVVSDVSRSDAAEEGENVVSVSENTLSVRACGRLSEEDEEKILAFLRGQRGKVTLSADPDESLSGFSPTEKTELPPQADESNFIKSRFPFRYAMKMGVSGLKVKPLRLAFTAILATVAFIIFGVFSTFVTYDDSKIAAVELANGGFTAAVLQKEAVFYSPSRGPFAENRRLVDTGIPSSSFTPAEIEKLNAEYGMEFIPAFTFNNVLHRFTRGQRWRGDYYYDSYDTFTAFADVSYLHDGDVTLLAGAYPATQREIMVSKLVFEPFQRFGYTAPGADTVVSIDSPKDLVGKDISIMLATDIVRTFTISAVFDSGEDFSEFDYLKTNYLPGVSVTRRKSAQSRLEESFKYSMAALCFVSSDFYETYRQFDETHTYYQAIMGQIKLNGFRVSKYSETEDSHCQYLFSPLQANREKRAKILMRDLNETVNPESDVYYFSPYSFLDQIAAGASILDKIFTYVSLAAALLAVFAALLLYGFISASINAKKKDIGVLRAVGARGVDVFKIFIVEALLITSVCFVLGCLGAYGACAVVNAVFVKEGVLTFGALYFDWINVLFVLGISLVTALIGTTLPVALTVRKKPVEAIRAI